MDSIDKILERQVHERCRKAPESTMVQEKIDLLVHRSEVLSASGPWRHLATAEAQVSALRSASSFRRDAEHLRRRVWWQNARQSRELPQKPRKSYTTRKGPWP